MKRQSEIEGFSFWYQNDWHFGICGFNQFNDNTDDKQRNSIEEQYLEKENGDWEMENIIVIPKK